MEALSLLPCLARSGPGWRCPLCSLLGFSPFLGVLFVATFVNDGPLPTQLSCPFQENKPGLPGRARAWPSRQGNGSGGLEVNGRGRGAS